jgi:hypothetical protein
MARHSSRQLRDRFGTDDPDEIKLKLDKLAVYEAEAETRRQEGLTAAEKEKERADNAERERDDARTALQRQVDSQTFTEFDGAARTAIGKYFEDDADTTDYAMDRLKKHVLALDDADLKEPAKVFDSWAKEYAEKHPKFAKSAPAPEKPKPKEIALDTGSKAQRPEKDDPKLATKTARPGQINSMNKVEYANHKKSLGLA